MQNKQQKPTKMQKTTTKIPKLKTTTKNAKNTTTNIPKPKNKTKNNKKQKT